MSINLTTFLYLLIYMTRMQASWTLIDSHAQICVCSELVANVANTTSPTSIVGDEIITITVSHDTKRNYAS